MASSNYERAFDQFMEMRAQAERLLASRPHPKGCVCDYCVKSRYWRDRSKRVAKPTRGH